MQRSFDGLDTPLHRVTFCVVDLETTGGSPGTCSITEIGAARFRGGECLGTFQTLVSATTTIEPGVTALTGITDEMVQDAPPLPQVLPALLEFVGGSVLVGHNVRFDVAFLDAALVTGERAAVGLHRVDTVALARRLMGGDVPDCRLATLAHHLRLDHRPTHRALDDVLATADLLHVLLERAASWGVTLLDDLLSLPLLAGHPQRAKVRLTNGLPRAPGVYVLRDGQGQALDVRAAVDLRREARALFSGGDARASGPLLREVQAIDHLVCDSPLAAEVAQIRLAQALQPRRGHRYAGWRRCRYVKLGAGSSPRLTVARAPGAGPARYLGPLPSAAAARAVIDAVATAASVATAVAPSDLFDEPARVLVSLNRCMLAALAEGRPAQAVALRAMGEAVLDAVRGQRGLDALRRAGRIVVDLPGSGRVEITGGRLLRPSPAGAAAAAAGGVAPGPSALAARAESVAGAPDVATVAAPPDDGPLPPAAADEVACVLGWIEQHAARLRLVWVEGELSSPLPRLPLLHRPCPAPPGATAAPGLAVAAGGLRCAAC